MASVYVNGIAISQRTDWHHGILPASVQGRRVASFAGIARKFVLMGPTLPPILELRGFFEASAGTAEIAVASLISQFRAWSILAGEYLTASVTIGTRTFSECQRLPPQWIGEVKRVYDPAGQVKVERAVFLPFEVLSWNVT